MDLQNPHIFAQLYLSEQYLYIDTSGFEFDMWLKNILKQKKIVHFYYQCRVFCIVKDTVQNVFFCSICFHYTFLTICVAVIRLQYLILMLLDSLYCNRDLQVN